MIVRSLGYAQVFIATVHLMHESYFLVVCVSFSAALSVRVLGNATTVFAHLPVHADQARCVRVFSH